MTGQDGKQQEIAAVPDFIVGQMRVQTAATFDFFHVGAQTTIPEADKTLDKLMAKLEGVVEGSDVAKDGPVVLVYSGTEQNFLLEAGYPVAAGTEAVGEAQVRQVEARRCASLLYWGSLAHFSKAHDALMRGMQEAGLRHGDDMREWYLHFEGDDSPNNIILLQHSLAQ